MNRWTDKDDQFLVDCVSSYMDEGRTLTESLKYAAYQLERTYSACLFRYQVTIKPQLDENLLYQISTNNPAGNVAHKKRLFRKIESIEEKIKKLVAEKKSIEEVTRSKGWIN